VQQGILSLSAESQLTALLGDNGIVATRTITINAERICPWAKMRHARAQFRSAATLPLIPFSVDYIINIAGFEFSVGTGAALLPDGRTVTVGRAEFDALLGKRRTRAWVLVRKQVPMPARR
jgi:hypothetical protein